MFGRCKVLVVGGGTGGCSIAAKLTSKLGKDSVIVVEPNDVRCSLESMINDLRINANYTLHLQRHYYQPMFTMIGGGMKTLSQSNYAMESVLPKGATWLKDRVRSFDPAVGSIETADGNQVNYDVLVLALGIELRYDKVGRRQR